jgi:hypothetical protein
MADTFNPQLFSRPSDVLKRVAAQGRTLDEPGVGAAIGVSTHRRDPGFGRTPAPEPEWKSKDGGAPALVTTGDDESRDVEGDSGFSGESGTRRKKKEPWAGEGVSEAKPHQIGESGNHLNRRAFSDYREHVEGEMSEKDRGGPHEDKVKPAAMPVSETTLYHFLYGDRGDLTDAHRETHARSDDEAKHRPYVDGEGKRPSLDDDESKCETHLGRLSEAADMARETTDDETREHFLSKCAEHWNKAAEAHRKEKHAHKTREGSGSAAHMNVSSARLPFVHTCGTRLATLESKCPTCA